jgi:hypothetical protein
VADSGAAQPKINVKVDGNLVCTADSNKGLQLSTAGTWVQTGVNLSTANYIVARNNVIDVRLTEVGTNGNAQDLTVALTFVLE